MVRVKELLDVAQKIITILAVIIGGFWTYKLYVEHREAYAKANISQTLTCIGASDRMRIVRLNVTIRNSGNSLLSLIYGEVAVRQIRPMTPTAKQKVDAIQRAVENRDPLLPSFEWDEIPMRPKPWHWRTGDFRIEPGESDETHVDFLIPLELEILEVATWLTGKARSNQKDRIGWQAQNVIDLRRLEGCK